MVVRKGEAFEAGEQLTVEGAKLRPGDRAPDFTLDYMDTQVNTVKPMRLADTAGTVRLLSVVPSLDTPVCHVQTIRWERERLDLPGVTVLTASMDLPFAQARWAGAQNVAHRALSAHKNESFGRDYGVLIREWRLLQRAVFVIDRNDRIVYADYVADQMQEPNYAAAIQAARDASSADGPGEPRQQGAGP